MIHFLIFLFGLLAGFVDSIAGGGGLIMLPGLLFTGMPAPLALGTNKMCGIAGSFTSMLKYSSHGHVDWKKGLAVGGLALLGSLLGSHSVGKIPEKFVEPIVIGLLIAVTVFVLLQPTFGTKEARRFQRHKIKTPLRYLSLSFFGFAIGFHDGFFGPGTGTFLIFVLLSLGSLNFLMATGTAKVINFLTNLVALFVFILAGTVDYGKGAAGACGYAAGSYAGTHLAVKKGAGIIRPLFIIVGLAVVAKLLFRYF